MKEFFKYLGLFILIIFSFYYTDKISTIVIYQSDLMKDIIANKGAYEIQSTSAIIEDNHIIPGLSGLKVNELDSYYQMKKSNTFSARDYVYDEMQPKESLANNKDLIINKANGAKRAVAIIVRDNDDVISFLKSVMFKANLLITYDEFDKNTHFELLNEKMDDNLEYLLDKYKINKDICFTNDQIYAKCVKEDKYLVEESYEVTNASVLGQDVQSGDIILIGDDLSLENFKIILRKILYQDLKLMYLSDLISETRNY